MGVRMRERGAVEDAVGRPVAPRRLPGRVGYHRLCASEIVPNLPRRQPQEAAVAVAVEGNLVPGRGDLGGELGQTLDLLADEKEGRPHVGLAEELEGGRGPLRVRSVVEGEQGSIACVETVAHTEGKAEWWADRGRPGKPVRTDGKPNDPWEQRRSRPKLAPFAASMRHRRDAASRPNDTAVSRCRARPASSSSSAFAPLLGCDLIVRTMISPRVRVRATPSVSGSMRTAPTIGTAPMSRASRAWPAVNADGGAT